MVYKSSFSNILKANKWLALVVGIAIPLMLYFSNEGRDWRFSFMMASFLTVGYLTAFFVKFWMSNVAEIEIDATKVRLTRLNQQVMMFQWSDFKMVWLSNNQWVFETFDGNKFHIVNDCFSSKDWLAITEAIQNNRKVANKDIKPNLMNERLSDLNSQSDFIIVPEYDPKLKWSPVIIMPVVLIGAYMIFTNDEYRRNPETIFCFGIMGLMMLALPLVLIRRIILAKDITLERYLGAPKHIAYSEITDITPKCVYTKKGNIPLEQVKNAYYITKALEEKRKQGTYSEASLEGQALTKEYLAQKAIVPSVILTFVALIALEFFGISITKKLPQLGWFVVWSVCYAVAYQFMHAREKKSKNL